ncbi:MAG TPA: VCBS repeat-containing protein [Armatimonadota bacterium]|nr:VCBS repeat-containing protein [Armatimonadota bacterium]
MRVRPASDRVMWTRTLAGRGAWLWIALLGTVLTGGGFAAPRATPRRKRSLPSFTRIVIDPTVENSSHKPKVFDRFSKDGFNDIGSLDRQGFKLYRYTQHWKPYVIFHPGNPGDFEDAVTADINGDGWKDIVLGGWGSRTIWAENPAGQGKDPYTTPWRVHLIGAGRLSHEVCAADLNHDGKIDVATTSGLYFQGATPDDWQFVSIGRGGQGTVAGNVLDNHDGYNDVIAVYQANGHNQIAWFENPGHAGGNPVTGHWAIHVIDPDPGGAEGSNRDMDDMALAFGDINGDHRTDIIAASMGEGPDKSNDPHQIGDGLVWYQAPADRRAGPWIKHVIDRTAGWVHASSIQLADFDGDRNLDVCYAEQDQSGPTPGCGPGRTDGVPSPRLVVCYNVGGKGTSWKEQVLSHYPEPAAGGFNSKVGIVGRDRLPSIVTSLHGWCNDANPILLWRNDGKPE